MNTLEDSVSAEATINSEYFINEMRTAGADSRKSARAIQIVRVLNDSILELDEAALRSVLLQERFKDMPVVVVSIAGKYRQGKSFLLNFILRFLQAKGSKDWLKKSKSVTEGFHWKPGPVGCTNGILIWSEPLIISQPNGEKVAVLLMDTQGTDDISGNVQQDVPVFALSALLSSVLVFNVQRIGKNDLDSLRLFLDYGRLASKSGGSATKPFQDLHFLVRDWTTPTMFEYGSKDGNQYLEHIIKQMGTCELKDALEMAFRKFCFFLMPHPGRTVDSDTFKGLISDVDATFLQYVPQFIAQVLDSKHLTIKEYIGKKVTVAELLPIVTGYFEFFKDGKCPGPENLYRTHQKKSYLQALDIAKEYLDSQLATYSNTKYVENLEVELRRVKNATLQRFHDTAKLGQCTKYDNKYMTYLDEYIKTSVKSKESANEAQKGLQILKEQSGLQAERASNKILLLEEEIKHMKESGMPEKEQNKAEIEALKKELRQLQAALKNEVEEKHKANSKVLLSEEKIKHLKESEIQGEKNKRAEIEALNKELTQLQAALQNEIGEKQKANSKAQLLEEKVKRMKDSEMREKDKKRTEIEALRGKIREVHIAKDRMEIEKNSEIMELKLTNKMDKSIVEEKVENLKERLDEEKGRNSKLTEQMSKRGPENVYNTMVNVGLGDPLGGIGGLLGAMGGMEGMGRPALGSPK